MNGVLGQSLPMLIFTRKSLSTAKQLTFINELSLTLYMVKQDYGQSINFIKGIQKNDDE